MRAHRRLSPTARGEPDGELVGAQAPQLVRVSLARAAHPARWGHEREGLVMSTPGSLSASLALPSAGLWDVWVQGEIMPSVSLSVDGRPLASIAGQLDGNSLVPDTVPPIPVRLSAGAHRLSLTRHGFTLAPGDGGQAVLDAIFLTPAGTDPQRIAARGGGRRLAQPVRAPLPVDRARSLHRARNVGSCRCPQA